MNCRTSRCALAVKKYKHGRGGCQRSELQTFFMIGPKWQFSTNIREIKGIGLAGNLWSKILAQSLFSSTTYKIKGSKKLFVYYHLITISSLKWKQEIVTGQIIMSSSWFESSFLIMLTRDLAIISVPIMEMIIVVEFRAKQARGSRYMPTDKFYTNYFFIKLIWID